MLKKQQGRILSPQLLFFFQFTFLSVSNCIFDSIHNTSCNYPCPWLHPPTGNTSDRRTIGKKQHKGLSTLKLSCPHSCHFSFCFPAVQSPPIRFLGDFQHFQGFPCLFLPFGCCILYALRISFYTLQFLKHKFYRKLRIYFGRGVLSLSGAVLPLLIGVILRLWV